MERFEPNPLIPAGIIDPAQSDMPLEFGYPQGARLYNPYGYVEPNPRNIVGTALNALRQQSSRNIAPEVNNIRQYENIDRYGFKPMQGLPSIMPNLSQNLVPSSINRDIGAFEAGVIPYVKEAAGFFTRPFGKEPMDYYSPEELITAQKKHPTTSKIGELVGGVAPYAVTQTATGGTGLASQVLGFGVTDAIKEYGRQKTSGEPMDYEKIGKAAAKGAALGGVFGIAEKVAIAGKPFLTEIGKAVARMAGISGVNVATDETFKPDMVNAATMALFPTAMKGIEAGLPYAKYGVQKTMGKKFPIVPVSPEQAIKTGAMTEGKTARNYPEYYKEALKARMPEIIDRKADEVLSGKTTFEQAVSDISVEQKQLQEGLKQQKGVKGGVDIRFTPQDMVEMGIRPEVDITPSKTPEIPQIQQEKGVSVVEQPSKYKIGQKVSVGVKVPGKNKYIITDIRKDSKGKYLYYVKNKGWVYDYEFHAEQGKEVITPPPSAPKQPQPPQKQAISARPISTPPPEKKMPLTAKEAVGKGMSAEEWVRLKFSEKPKYGMGHRPSYEDMPPAHNLLEGDVIPRDVYEHPEFSVASGRNLKTDKAAQESWRVLQKIRDNPEAEITVYRAGREKKLNIGDWITFSKEYANQSLEAPEKVYSYKIKAKDAIFAGDDINEFGYYPKSQFLSEYEKAKGTAKEPWQMTKEEFLSEATKQYEKSTPVENKAIYGKVKNKETGELETKIIKYQPIKNKVTPEHIKTWEKYKKDIIQKALSEGKPIPPEVLKDYPELQKRKGEAGFLEIGAIYEKARETKEKLLEDFQDSQLKIRRLMERKDVKVSDATNQYEKEAVYYGKIKTQTDKVDTISKDIIEDVVNTAQKYKLPTKDMRDIVNKYLIAKHAPERNLAHGEKAAKMSTAEANEIVRRVESSPDFKDIGRIANKVLDLDRQTLQILKEGDVIDDALYNKLTQKYKYHVSLQRMFEETENINDILMGKGFDVKSTGIKRAVGSEREISDIISNTVANVKQAIVRAEKNRLDRSIWDFAQENKHLGLFEVTQPPIYPVGKVKYKSEIDLNYMRELRKFAESLGAKWERGGQIGRVAGYYHPISKTIERKFATGRETAAHETAHFFDDKYKLKQRFYKRGQSKAVAEEMLKHMEISGESANRMKKTEERFADAFSWWLTHRDLAKETLPLFSKEMEKIIGEIPDLSPILKIKPQPGANVEGMEEMVFARQKFINDPQVLTLRIDGKPAYLKINNESLALALRGVNRGELGDITRVVGKFSRVLAQLATRYNPSFAPVNIMRDLPEALSFLAAQKDVGLKGAVSTLKYVPESLYEVAKAQAGKPSPVYAEMMAEGGTTGGVALGTKQQINKSVEDFFSEAQQKNYDPRKVIRKLGDYADAWNTIFEDATRLSVYKQAKFMGLSKQRAAFLAKEASINFNKFGKHGPTLNAWYMFMNPSIQGSIKMMRSIKNPKVAATIAGIALMAQIITQKMNDAVDKDWENKVSEWDKQNGLPIYLGTKDDGTSRYAVLPVSWGMKPINAIARAASDVILGKKVSIKDTLGKVIDTIIEGYNPAGGTDFPSAITPTILDAPLDIWRNRKWTGGKMRPDYDKYLPKSKQYYKSLEKEAEGKMFIKVADGLSKTNIEISPADMEYVYKTLIGGAGRFVSQVGNLPKNIQEPSKYPFVSRFYRSVPSEQQKDTGIVKTAIDALTGQSTRRFEEKKVKEQLFDEFGAKLKELPPQEAMNRLTKMNEIDGKLLKEFYDYKTKSNRPYADALIKQMSPKDTRPQFFNKMLKDAPKEKKLPLMQEWVDKGLLTDEIAEQIISLQEQK